jgi:hypothetical protein
MRQESIIQKFTHGNAKEINPGELRRTFPTVSWFLLGEIVRCIFGSVEIARDMFVKTLLGVFAVPAGKGKLEKILKKIFEFSAVPSRRAELKNYSQRNSFEPFAPARLWQTRKYSVEYFLRACPVLWTRQTPP